MESRTLTLAVSSPEELEKKMVALSYEGKKDTFRYASLAISGPQVLVSPFSLPNLKVKELKERVCLESVELLNLPASDIEFDFQILNKTEEKVEGIFVCTPKQLVQNYFDIIKNSGLTLLKITPYILSSINSFFQQHAVFEGRFCLIDFTKENYINLAVVNDHKFQLLRKVPFDSIEEARREIIRSLRSACAQSQIKHFDHIYFSGDLSQKKDIISSVEKIFNTDSECRNFNDVELALKSEHNVFSINLVRNSTLSLKQRQLFMTVMNVVLIVSLLSACYLGFRIHEKNGLIKDEQLSLKSLKINA